MNIRLTCVNGIFNMLAISIVKVERFATHLIKEKKVTTLILLVFLFLCSVWDCKVRKIPLWLCHTSAFFIIICELLAKEIAFSKMLGGILVGLFLLGLTKITRGQIGLGDGIVFIVIGLGIGLKESFLLLLESLFLLFLFCLIGLIVKKIKIKQRIPFLPFVFSAYFLKLLLRYHF